MINNSPPINIKNENIYQYQIQSIEYYNNEKYVECMNILNKLIELNTNDIIALCNRATCNYKLELYKHCIKDCEIILCKEPNNKIALLRKAKALKQLSNYDIELVNSLRKKANNSWGYLSVTIDDNDDDNYININNNNNKNKNVSIPSPKTTTTSSIFISTSPPLSQQSQQQFHTMTIREQQQQQQQQQFLQEQQMLIYQEQQQQFLQEQQEMIDDLLSSPPLSLSEIHQKQHIQGDGNNIGEEEDEEGEGGIIVKSDSMEELNKLLEQLSTENIATLISQGNTFVNAGQYEEAIELFTMIIDNNPLVPSLYLGRGTSNAFLGQLNEAINDFSRAIELDNTSSDAYKRRGQSKVAKSMEQEALEDFNQAVAFDKEDDYDIYYNRGLLHYQMRNYERALKDFKKVTSIEPSHKLAWNRIGLCLNVNGYPMEAYQAFAEALRIDPYFEASHTNIGQCWKDLGKFSPSYQSFTKALEICPNYSNALHLRGLLFFNSGRHLDAIKDWNLFLKLYGSGGANSSGSNIKTGNHYSSGSGGGGGGGEELSSIIDVRQFRGVVNQSIGAFRKAVSDYDQILQTNPLHNCFYQREIALWTHHHLNTPLSTFNIDRLINCYLKTFQCQRIPNTSLTCNSIGLGFQLQSSFNQSIADVEICHQLNNEQLSLFKEARRIGEMLQYNCDGFLTNSRQKLQCGLSVIEMAQTLKKLWLSGNKKSNVFQMDGKSSSVSTKKHTFGWRDLYDIGVKWRQISEPNDPVWWGDLLSPEQFKEGFGSHTPIITGQCKVVRYYPMFEKSFEIMKLLLPIQHPSLISNQTILDQLESATTCKDLYKLIKKDFFVVTPCYSRSNENKVMEGTRLTLQYIHPEGYEFAIRTPSTPYRWEQYSQELDIIWDQLIDKVFIYQNIINSKEDLIDNSEAASSSSSSSSSNQESILLDEISELILCLSFYWYNFMPLSRGSAALGFTTLLGLFLSLDITITSPIPKNQQPDWEAILRPTTTSFISVIKPWLYPARSKFNLQTTSLVSSQFNTIKKMIQVLNISNQD
ncbi:hypothetical protein ACTFIW_011503 [Dictyostelium discoideum]